MAAVAARGKIGEATFPPGLASSGEVLKSTRVLYRCKLRQIQKGVQQQRCPPLLLLLLQLLRLVLLEVVVEGGGLLHHLRPPLRLHKNGDARQLHRLCDATARRMRLCRCSWQRLHHHTPRPVHHRRRRRRPRLHRTTCVNREEEVHRST